MNTENALRVFLTCVLIYCSLPSLAQSTSSQGKEFWTAYMSHIEDNGESQMALYVTADDATDVTLQVADNSFAPITKAVEPGQVTIIVVPKIVFLKNDKKYIQKGLHITARKNVAVFAHIYSKNVSGATLLLPVAALGKSYYSINFTQESNAQLNAFSTFMVVAAEDNTEVEITPAKQMADGRPAGKPILMSLNKGDVYQGFSFYDLTSTKIRSVSSAGGVCKKIAVFSGSTKIGIGCHDDEPNHFSSDNLFQQVYPTAAWGKNYITVPLQSRNYDVYRVIFSDPDTHLTINGQVIPQANYQTPYYYEFDSQTANSITADKPVQVVQYAVSQGKALANGCQYLINDRGDPEMIYLNPLEQTLDHVTLYSTNNFAIIDNYINVVIPTNMRLTFKVDGNSYTTFFAVKGNPSYSYAQISVTSGAHTLTAAEGFSATAYGFGNAESYGYSAGTNLKNLNESIIFTNAQGSIQTDGCSDEQYKLRLSLPFQATKIVWNFKGAKPGFTDTNPVFTGTGEGTNGKTLYYYQFHEPVSFSVGDHSILATATNPMADDCGADVDVDFDFNIAERLHPFFSLQNNFCSADNTFITAQGSPDITKVKIWWDFSNDPDNFEVFDKNHFPSDNRYHHQYLLLTTDKEYLIRMEAFTGATYACSDAYEKSVNIKGNPVVSFEHVAPLCVGFTPVQLISNNNGYTGIGKYYGPGVTESGKFDSAVTGAGTFNINYVFLANNGCDVTYSQQIVVNPLPFVKAGEDLNLLEGDTKVLPAEASGEALTYKWEPATGLDNPNTLNPACTAIESINYKLTVTTAAGCTAQDNVFVYVLKKPVIVNAFTPNGDGINDTWEIKYLNTYPANTVDIYNRQGEKVYSSVGYAVPWDGKYKGQVLPTGTYYYIINPKNGRKPISGSVTIIK